MSVSVELYEAEHTALHRYLVGLLAQTATASEYSDLVVAHDAVAGALDSGIVQETGSDQVHDPRVFHPESECDWCAAHPERRVSRG